jgi:hypothetical protein
MENNDSIFTIILCCSDKCGIGIGYPCKNIMFRNAGVLPQSISKTEIAKQPRQQLLSSS